MKITVLPQNSLADKNKWRVLNPSKCPLNIILIIYILITSSLPYELLSTKNYELQLRKNENITCNSNSSVYIQAFKFTGNIFTLFFFFWLSVLIHHVSEEWQGVGGFDVPCDTLHYFFGYDLLEEQATLNLPCIGLAKRFVHCFP